MYCTTIYSTTAPSINAAYIVETEIQGTVIETKYTTSVPRTNRGLQKKSGWLGSWTDTAGTTFDTYSRGLCALVERIELIREDGIEGEPDRLGWELRWQPVND